MIDETRDTIDEKRDTIEEKQEDVDSEELNSEAIREKTVAFINKIDFTVFLSGVAILFCIFTFLFHMHSCDRCNTFWIDKFNKTFNSLPHAEGTELNISSLVLFSENKSEQHKEHIDYKKDNP